ncbi:MAG: alcohol dehydrogenase catalytic domain-containing protein, partial [Sedimentisphaerales bacterium]|nr:alcohol dehydrogenase catalytic domain-containing protein [Sedimentisphaerales bacterium]
MQALTCSSRTIRFVADWPDPKPAAEEVLIGVHLAGICGTDLEIAEGYMDFEGVMGHEFVGTVLKGPRDLLGRRVVAQINCICGRCDMCQSGLSNHCRHRQVIGIQGRDGAFAERIAVPKRNLQIVPDSVDNDQAVFIEPLAAAFQIVKQVPIEPRDKVIVVGDGRLGLLAVQVLSRHGKPGNVILLGKHPDKLTFAEKRGIQGVLLAEMLIKPVWDIVVDCTGTADGFATACRLVRPRGRLILKSTRVQGKPVDLSSLVIDEISLIGSRCGPFADAVNALAAQQVVTTGLITARLPLAEGEKAFGLARQADQI